MSLHIRQCRCACRAAATLGMAHGMLRSCGACHQHGTCTQHAHSLGLVGSMQEPSYDSAASRAHDSNLSIRQAAHTYTTNAQHITLLSFLARIVGCMCRACAQAVCWMLDRDVQSSTIKLRCHHSVMLQVLERSLLMRHDAKSIQPLSSACFALCRLTSCGTCVRRAACRCTACGSRHLQQRLQSRVARALR